ncbi:MAG TPA: hypothetical protein VID75_08550 [Acidimicrobiales bacterium]
MAVEVAALVVLMVAPGPARAARASAARLSPVAGGSPDGGPSQVGRHPEAPTTTAVPPAPSTTAPPTTTAPPAPPPSAPAPRIAPPPPLPAPPPPAQAPTRGILPPGNPAANIAPQPNFLAACSSSGDDNTPGCTNTTVAAIDNARRVEGLAGMALPGNWGALTPQEQLFVGTNLERTARGLPALSAMATVLDQAAASGAASGTDPSPPGGFPFEQWGGNWAGGVGNPLEAIYYWMYDDGPGSANADCTPGNSAGCWGHRDEMLLSLSCTPCVMGTGFADHAWQGQPSWAELLVGSSGSPALDFTWQQEAAYLS